MSGNMISDLSEAERKKFLTQSFDSFIPGYTGHCPTLKFHFGSGYGRKTKDILEQICISRIHANIRSEPILKPIVKDLNQLIDHVHEHPRYISGYTGFVPRLQYSIDGTRKNGTHAQSNIQRRAEIVQKEIDKMFRIRDIPKMTSIRCQDEVQQAMKKYQELNRFQEHKISPEFPPIAGYTGYIPGVNGNEASLSQRYNTVVKRGLTILQNEREKRSKMKQAQNQLSGVMEEFRHLPRSTDTPPDLVNTNG